MQTDPSAQKACRSLSRNRGSPAGFQPLHTDWHVKGECFWLVSSTAIPWKRVAAEARVAWPHRSASLVGVNHLRRKCASSAKGLLLRLPLVFAGSTKAVSDRFISAPMCCIMAASILVSSKQTAAGLPPKGFAVKASTCSQARPVNFLYAYEGSWPVLSAHLIERHPLDSFRCHVSQLGVLPPCVLSRAGCAGYANGFGAGQR